MLHRRSRGPPSISSSSHHRHPHLNPHSLQLSYPSLRSSSRSCQGVQLKFSTNQLSLIDPQDFCFGPGPTGIYPLSDGIDLKQYLCSLIPDAEVPYAFSEDVAELLAAAVAKLTHEFRGVWVEAQEQHLQCGDLYTSFPELDFEARLTVYFAVCSQSSDETRTSLLSSQSHVHSKLCRPI